MVLSMERWRGKVAVVTGASSGIGAALAQELVEYGLKVVGLARRVERIEKMAKNMAGKSGVLHGLKVDITKTEEIIETFKIIEKRFGPIHILVNNAGVFEATTLIGGDIDKWKKIFDTNVMGLCVATREAIDSMNRNNVDGHIIHINSVVGHLVPFETVNVYSASKYAVTALTETLRIELLKAESKIKVTSISPGFVHTELIEATGLTSVSFDEFPTLRPEDVADTAVYALSTPSHVQVSEVMVRPIGAKF
ncbi:hypothetical protein HHI36_005838 [Cryptolaemus montrouzieri]|uniref:Farnesol dehydrogenase-like n=1 Tax=Cryptolaemus montrouzieri TaxID=559131 RepID=A0ABD2NVJ6_9CUCU